MVTIIELRAPGERSPPIGRLGPDEIIIRNNYTGLFVPLVSYPNAEIPKDRDERMHWFPDMEHFSPEHFVWVLEKMGWEYQGVGYNGRDLVSHTRVSEFGRNIEIETLPDGLLEYTINPLENLDSIVINAERRMRTFYPLAGFSTPKHGEYLSEELYAAGWLWYYKKCGFDNNDSTTIWKIWEMENIPDVLK